MAEEDLPDVLECGQMLILSQRVREVIEPWLKDYEFLPTEIELCLTDEINDVSGGGPIIPDYWLLNCWRLLDLTDWERSDVVMAAPQGPVAKYHDTPVKFVHWKRLGLMPGVLREEHFFGTKYYAGALRFLSPELHRALLARRFRLKFRPHLLGPPRRSPSLMKQELNDGGYTGSTR